MYVFFLFLALLFLGPAPAHIGPFVTALAIGRALGFILESFELMVLMAAVGASVARVLLSVPPVLAVGRGWSQVGLMVPPLAVLRGGLAKFLGLHQILDVVEVKLVFVVSEDFLLYLVIILALN